MLPKRQHHVPCKWPIYTTISSIFNEIQPYILCLAVEIGIL